MKKVNIQVVIKFIVGFFLLAALASCMFIFAPVGSVGAEAANASPYYDYYLALPNFSSTTAYSETISSTLYGKYNSVDPETFNSNIHKCFTYSSCCLANDTSSMPFSNEFLTELVLDTTRQLRIHFKYDGESQVINIPHSVAFGNLFGTYGGPMDCVGAISKTDSTLLTNLGIDQIIYVFNSPYNTLYDGSSLVSATRTTPRYSRSVVTSDTSIDVVYDQSPFLGYGTPSVCRYFNLQIFSENLSSFDYQKFDIEYFEIYDTDEPLTYRCKTLNLFSNTMRNINNDLANLYYNYGYYSGYNTGEDAGYTDGYSAGNEVGTASGYESGYTAGNEAGTASGYQSGYTEGYEAGSATASASDYDTGYQDGHTAGTASGYSDGYDVGYTEGLDFGAGMDAEAWATEIYGEGYDEGYNDGEEAHSGDIAQGYAQGYSAGATDGAEVENIIPSAVGSIGSVIMDFLDFEILPGFKLWTILAVLGGVLIIGIVLKLVL